MMQKPNSICEVPKLIYEKGSFASSGEGQCDCACAETTPTISGLVPLQLDKRYRLFKSFKTIPVNGNYHAATTNQVNVVVLNRPALEIAHSFVQPHSFDNVATLWRQTHRQEVMESIFHDFVQAGLLITEDQIKTSPIEAPETLISWLHITDRCNLRCAYCYLPHERKDMSLEVGQAAVKASFRSATKYNYKRIKFKYAGGEPLIRFATIEKLHEFAQKLSSETGVELDGVVLSNGTLLNAEIVESIKSLNLRIMISVDGIGRFHDSQRVYANGHGTFADVVRGVELALSFGIVPDISVTVNGRNASGLPEVMAWILEHELPFSLNFYRENDLSLSHADLQLKETEIINGMSSAFQVIERKLPTRNLLASLVDRANLSVPHSRTCGVGNNYLVFDHLGGVAKCQMQLRDTLTDINENDPLMIVRADLHGIQNLHVEEKEGCRNCQWKKWCTGGCPLITYRATGRYDVKSPNCGIYTALFPKAVRLEGLRLLKYADEL